MNRNVRRMLLPTGAAAVVGVIVTTLIVGNGSGPVRAANGDASTPNTVSVSGLGRVTGTPDVLRLAMGVQRTGSDVNDALNRANGDIKRITDALHKHNVADKDIQTSNLSINPHWDSNRINGYDVAESLTVQLRKLADAGAAISDAAAAGGNATRIDSVSFDIEDNQQLVDQARTAAFADARAKAEQYAKLSGRSLGRVSQVSESTETEPRPVPYAAMDAAGAAEKSAVPISAGSQQVSVTTSVVWELN